MSVERRGTKCLHKFALSVWPLIVFHVTRYITLLFSHDPPSLRFVRSKVTPVYASRACLLGGEVPIEKRNGERKALKEGSTRGEKEEQRNEQKSVSLRCNRCTMGDS